MINEPLMTVVEARQMMPDTTASLSDTQVEQIIVNLDILADSIVKAVLFDDEYRVNIAYNRGEKLE
jgi:hypothetical protein